MLLVDDGRYRGAEEDDPRHVFHMDALVEHVDAEEEFQVAALVVLECGKGGIRRRVVGVGGIDAGMFVDAAEPRFHMGPHFF